MSDLPPVRSRRDWASWTGVAVAGVLCVLAALLPWIQVPVGFERLQVKGTDRAAGLVVLVIGIALLALSAAAARRPAMRLAAMWPAVLGLVLAGIAWLSWSWAHDVLHQDVPGLGVHPGRTGAGLRVLIAAAVLVLATAAQAHYATRSAAVTAEE